MKKIRLLMLKMLILTMFSCSLLLDPKSAVPVKSDYDLTIWTKELEGKNIVKVVGDSQNLFALAKNEKASEVYKKEQNGDWEKIIELQEEVFDLEVSSHFLFPYLFVANTNGIKIYTLEGNLVKKFFDNKKQGVMRLTAVKKGIYYSRIFKGVGVLKYEDVSQDFRLNTKVPETVGTIASKDEIVYFGNSEGIYRTDESLRKVVPMDVGFIAYDLATNKNILAATTTTDIHIYENNELYRIVEYPKNSINPKLRPYWLVLTEDVLWIASDFGFRLFSYSMTKNEWQEFQLGGFNDEGLGPHRETINDLAYFEGQVFVSTTRGLFILSLVV